MSWSNWGWSALQSLTEATQSTVSSYVSPALSSVSRSTASFVNDLANQMDPDTENEGDSEQKVVAVVMSDSIPQSPRPSVAPSSSSSSDVDQLLLSYIDSGVNFIANSAEYFTDVVKNTVSTVANSDVVAVMEKSKTLINTELIQKGVEVGSVIMDKSLDAFEKVSTAIMSTEEEKESESNILEETSPKEETEKISFPSAFEDANGISHIQNLESISLDARMKTQVTYRKLLNIQKEKVDEEFSKIQEHFKDDNESNVTLTAPEFPEMSSNLITHLNSTLKTFKKTKSLNSWSNEPEDMSNLQIFIEKKLMEIELKEKQYTKTLGLLCSLSVELLLRIAEWCLETVGNNGESLNYTKFNSISTRIGLLCNFFEQELHGIFSKYQEIIQKISSSAIETLKPSNIDPNSIITKCNSTSTNAYINLAPAISNIQEAKKQLLLVSKYVITAITEKNTTLHTPNPLHITSELDIKKMEEKEISKNPDSSVETQKISESTTVKIPVPSIAEAQKIPESTNVKIPVSNIAETKKIPEPIINPQTETYQKSDTDQKPENPQMKPITQSQEHTKPRNTQQANPKISKVKVKPQPLAPGEWEW